VLLRSRLRSLVLRPPSPCIFRARRPVRKFSSGTIQPLSSKYQKRKNRLWRRGFALGHAGLCVGEVKVAFATSWPRCAEVYSCVLCEQSLKGTQSLAVRPRSAYFPFCLLVFASSSFSLSGSLSPSSQVSRGVLCLLRYDGSGRVHRGHPDVLVSSFLSPWRHEL
jgi:hypothetical protein